MPGETAVTVDQSPAKDNLPPVQNSDLKTVEDAAWRLLNIAAELNDSIRRMTEHARIVGPSGKEQKFTTLKDLVLCDLEYLVSRFSMIHSQAASRRALSLGQVFAVFAGQDPQTFAEPSIVQMNSDLIRNTQAGDTGCKAGRAVELPPAFQLVQEYDELFGTKNAERLGDQYLSVANTVAAADHDEDSRATLAKIESMLRPSQAEIKLSQPTDSVENLFKELSGLVGLSRVKADVTQLANYIKVQHLRKQQGLKAPDLSLHVVFYGNPGTGKTTVARLLANLYHALGVLSKGQLIETDRSGLVAGHVGQTALKVKGWSKEHWAAFCSLMKLMR